MSLHAPTTITPLPNFRLWMRFADGTEGTVDLSSLAGKGVFQRWSTDPASFAKVAVAKVAVADDGSLQWDGELDLCSDALYLQITGRSVEQIFPTLKEVTLHA